MEAILELYARATLVVAAVAAHRSLRQLLTLDQPGRPFLPLSLIAAGVALLGLYGLTIAGVMEITGPLQLGLVGALFVVLSGSLRPVRHVWTAQVTRDSVARDLLRDRSGGAARGLPTLPRTAQSASVPSGPELILREGGSLKGQPSSPGVASADPSGVRPALGSRLVTPNPDA